jgi:LPXTG-site transpeptidase (sortase) family protein
MYMTYAPKEQSGDFFRKVGSLYTLIGVFLIIGGFIFLVIPSIPYIYYSINPAATEDEIENLSSFINTVSAATPSVAPITPTPTIAEPEKQLPPIDPSLPKENVLLIPSIGVNGPINEGRDSKRALYKGIWRTPDWGVPSDFTKPTILAAHRFGYIEWSANFRKTNSFSNLPNVKVGDEIIVLWGQRKFVYKVKAIEESTQISVTRSDLILYTCKHLKSPVRVVVFADLNP